MSNRLTAPVLIGEENATGRSTSAAFGGGAIIGALGGLIGLGGVEFRLPLLIGAFRFCSAASGDPQQGNEPRRRRFRFAVPGCKRLPLPPSRRIDDHREPARRQSAWCVVRGRVGNPARIADALSRHCRAAAVHRGRARARTHHGAGIRRCSPGRRRWSPASRQGSASALSPPC
jgi:hypothetical protein